VKSPKKPNSKKRGESWPNLVRGSQSEPKAPRGGKDGKGGPPCPLTKKVIQGEKKGPRGNARDGPAIKVPKERRRNRGSGSRSKSSKKTGCGRKIASTQCASEFRVGQPCDSQREGKTWKNEKKKSGGEQTNRRRKRARK